MKQSFSFLALAVLLLSCEDNANPSHDDTAATDADTVSQDDILNPDDASGEYTGPDDIGAMVEVPAGEFMMGCNEEVDTQCYPPEYPYHQVYVSAFQIGKYEVTAGEYKKCVATGACNNNNSEEPQYIPNGCNMREGREKYPMNCVSWFGAKAYCEWAEMRLPTEAEWEKAARGADGRKYPWGNEGFGCEYAIMEIAGTGISGCGEGHTWPVGGKEMGKSPYGAYDMVGNVMEWVFDWFNKTYYETSPTNDPLGPDEGITRGLRGGCYGDYSDSHYLRTARRYDYPPEIQSDLRTGFRCVKE